jgi:release factor glutamine methyltransferase
MKTISGMLKQSHTNQRDVELLIAHVLGVTKEYVVAHPEHHLSWRQRIHLNILLKKRARDVPLAYLMGHKEFFGLDFDVNKHTLIPRPETELIVSLVLNKLKASVDQRPMTVIDIGTGSGCISISIANFIGRSRESTVKLYATDISKKTLHVAKRNAIKHDVNITFLHGNLLEPIAQQPKTLNHKASVIIIANLPYLSQEEFEQEPTIRHEPHAALVAADGGLSLYKKLLKQIHDLKRTFAQPITCLLEMNPSQVGPMKNISIKLWPRSLVSIHKDLSGTSRVLQIDLPSSTLDNYQQTC